MPPRLQVTLCLKGRSHVDLFRLVLVSNKSYSMSQLLCACVFDFSPWIAESAFLGRGFQRLDQIVVILSDKFRQRIKFKELVIYKSSCYTTLRPPHQPHIRRVVDADADLNISRVVEYWCTYTTVDELWRQLASTPGFRNALRLADKTRQSLIFVWKMRAA